MSVATRPFAQDVFHLTLSKVSASGGQGTFLADLVSVFTNCRWKATTTRVNKRAVWESTAYPIPIEKAYNITVGAVLDAEFPSLLYLYLTQGIGPYRLTLYLNGYTPLHATGIITETGLGSSGEVFDQDLAIEVQGDFA